MANWLKDSAYSAYMKIAEPRVVRLIQFGIYICLLIVGIMILHTVPRSMENAAGGHAFAVGFGWMLIVGAFSSGVAVLPGIWWLERAGLVMLSSGMLIYLVMIIQLNTSPMGVVVCIILTLTFVQRWLEIKGAQLAPLLPKQRG